MPGYQDSGMHCRGASHSWLLPAFRPARVGFRIVLGQAYGRCPKSPITGSLDLFDEHADSVEFHTGQRFEMEGRELDWLARFDRCLKRQPIAEQFVNGFLERLAGFALATVELGPEAIVDSYRGSHIAKQ